MAHRLLLFHEKQAFPSLESAAGLRQCGLFRGPLDGALRSVTRAIPVVCLDAYLQPDAGSESKSK